MRSIRFLKNWKAAIDQLTTAEEKLEAYEAIIGYGLGEETRECKSTAAKLIVIMAIPELNRQQNERRARQEEKHE